MITFKLISKIEIITEDDKKTLGLIQDIIDDKIYISVASDDKQFKILRVGDSITGVVYEESVVTSFDAIITDRIAGNLATYEISSMKNFAKVQRRQDVRVDCTIPILYTDNKYLLKIDVDNKTTGDIISSNERYLNKGWISDLSAGGLRFSADKKYHLESILLLVFELETDKIITKGQIVYKGTKITTDKTVYIYGIKFININDEEKEKIISNNFIVMRRNRLSKRG